MSKRDTLRHTVLLLPFGIAGIVAVFLSIADRLRLSTEYIAEFSYAFARPWAWLLGWASVPNTSNWIRVLALYIVVLWLPAALYSAVIWLILHAIDYATAAHAKHGPPHPA